jgi:long-chain acyl-CoA synthetase
MSSSPTSTIEPMQARRRDIEAERATIELAIAGRTLCSELARTVELHGDLEALTWKAGGERQAMTWRDYRARVREVSLGLRELGFERGGFALVLSGNRPEHVVGCQGIMHALGTPVALYDALAPTQVAYIANHCEATVAVVEADLLHVLLQIRAELPNLRHVVVCGPRDELEPSDWLIGWDELLAIGRAEHERDPFAFESAVLDVAPDDLATVIYTSGTTGPPKGVMLTHRFALCWVEAWSLRTRAMPGDRIVSYLPLAHCTSQWLTQWQATVCATVTHFCADPSQLVPTLREVRPTWFLGVPRIWEKLRTAITASVGDGSSSGLDAIGLDRCRVPVICAAPCPAELIEFFHALNLPLADGWGMTELGFGTWNGLEQIKPGTIGPPIPGIEARLARDGELLVRGLEMMTGYYKDPTRTAETIDADGWLHTGDIAEVDADGYYRIIDRKKDLIITTSGKNISPSNLETLLKEHPLIGQACVIGDNRDHITALIVLEPALAAGFTAQPGIQAASISELAAHPDVVAEVTRHVQAVNQRLSAAEQILAFRILPTEWTVEGEELTPTLKIRRATIEHKHAREIKAMYA